MHVLRKGEHAGSPLHAYMKIGDTIWNFCMSLSYRKTAFFRLLAINYLQYIITGLLIFEHIDNGVLQQWNLIRIYDSKIQQNPVIGYTGKNRRFIQSKSAT